MEDCGCDLFELREGVGFCTEEVDARSAGGICLDGVVGVQVPPHFVDYLLPWWWMRGRRLVRGGIGTGAQSG